MGGLAPRILTVYAHPDDESFGPAAVLAKYARRGAVIHGVFATLGERGEPLDGLDFTPEQLAQVRERDLRDAAAAIGYAGLEVLGYADGTLADLPDGQLEALVLAAIQRYMPDVVITFGPGGITRHPDHLAISQATTAAVEHALRSGAPPMELYYDAVRPQRAEAFGIADLPDGQPNTWIDVSDTVDVKLEALRCHARHIKDAQQRLEQLEREPETVATLYRAWPEVAPGLRLTGLLTEDSNESKGRRPTSF
jgi:LmbE family N-acetylglucosaminyl deacetylase